MSTIGPFAELKPTELAVLEGYMEPVTFPQDACIFREGSAGDDCYLIDEGQVRLEVEQPEIDADGLLGYLEPGMFLGELSLLERMPRSATAYAHTDVYHQTWLERRPVDTSELRRLPLFGSLSDAELGLIAHSAYEDIAAVGEAIVRQWDPTCEFYVVVEGTAEVRTEERHLADLPPGDFFGELAALGWGRTSATRGWRR